MTEPRIECVVCWQDYLRLYRSTLDGREFLLCPECDSVWLPGEDTSQRAKQSLGDLFEGHLFRPGEVAWDLIEPA
jgi:uncharacterized C2H2 Zn-finger protein